jgi:hypothetical protein
LENTQKNNTLNANGTECFIVIAEQKRVKHERWLVKHAKIMRIKEFLRMISKMKSLNEELTESEKVEEKKIRDEILLEKEAEKQAEEKDLKGRLDARPWIRCPHCTRYTPQKSLFGDLECLMCGAMWTKWQTSYTFRSTDARLSLECT